MAALGNLSLQLAVDIRQLLAGEKLTEDALLRISTYADKSFSKLQSAADAAATRLSGGLNRSLIETTAALEGATRGTAKYAEVEARLKGIDVTPEIRSQIDALKQLEGQLKNNSAANINGGQSAKQLAFALRGVPAQFTDIAVSLQGGQKPLTVLLQQGGQLKDMFGGIGPAAQAMGGYVAGLINPFTLAAAAILGLGAAYAAGANESTRLNTALVNTGNITGITTGNLNTLAGSVGELTGKYGVARDAVQALAASGLIAGRDIPNALKGIVAGVDVTGKSVQDLTKDFEKLATNPLKGLVELNKTQNFLTLEIYKQVEALEKQGKTQEASTLAIKTYQETLEERKGSVVKNLGIFQQMWVAVKKATDAAGDSIKGIGRTATNSEQLKKVAKEYADLLAPKNYATGETFGSKSEIASKLTELKKYSAAVLSENTVLAAAGKARKAETDKINQRETYNTLVGDASGFSKGGLQAKQIAEINLKFNAQLKLYGVATEEYKTLIVRRDQAIANINDKAAAPGIRAAESAALRAARAAQAASDKELNGFQSLLNNIKQKNSEYQAAILTNDKLAASDANQIKLNELLGASHGALAKNIKAKEVAAIKAAIATERSNEADAAQKLLNDQVSASLEKTLKITQDLAQNEQDRVDALQRQIDVFGLSEQAVSALEAAKLNDAAATYEQSIALMQQAGASKETVDWTYAQIDAIKAKAKALEQFGIKTSELDGLKAAKKANEELVRDTKKAAEEINKSLTDALLRGFESGKGFAKNFRDTLKNMFQTLVLRPVIDLVLRGSGITGVLGSIGSLFSGGASAASGAGSSALGSLFSGAGSTSTGGLLKSLLGGTSGQLTGLNNLVQSFSNVIGNAGFPKLASSLFNYSGAISKALPFAGAAFSLLKGDVKGAAIQGIGTALGSFTPIGPIGGAIISALLGGVFGSREKGKGDRTNGSFVNGTFTSLREYSGDKGGSLGAGASLTAVSKSLTETLGGYLKNFGLNPNIQTDLSFGSKKGNSHTDLSGTIDGVGFGSYLAGDFQSGITNVLTVGFVNALKASKLTDGLKSLFDGISDKTQLDSLINSTVLLQQSQKDLTAKYGLTVDAAAKVAKASGLAGESLIAFVDKLSVVASTGKTFGAQFIASRDVLETQLNKVYGDIVTSAVTSAVTTQVPVNSRQNTGNKFFGNRSNNGDGGGLNGFFGGNNGGGLNGFFGKAAQQYVSVTKNVTTYIDALVSKSIALPASLEAYDALLKSINTTTKLGAKEFADVFTLRDQFAAYIASLDALKGGVKGATFGLRSPAEQAALLNTELNAMFTKLGVTVPKTAKDLLGIGDSIDFTTKAGLDLAAAFPSLVDAFEKTKASVDAVTESVSRAETSFSTLVDQQRYEGVSKNYNSQFAADYTSNLEAGRIVNGRVTSAGATNDDLVAEIKMLRAGIETIAISNSRLVKYEAKKDLIAGVS